MAGGQGQESLPPGEERAGAGGKGAVFTAVIARRGCQGAWSADSRCAQRPGQVQSAWVSGAFESVLSLTAQDSVAALGCYWRRETVNATDFVVRWSLNSVPGMVCRTR
jgi:hypothetical protein